ncbi:RNA 2',3'-cyclic phosphodiesterase [Propionivibrio limicola]|uniref:RNA 2',3'-cyclic phosphodiesterase n=1 Tax=Propionivibrio limicola TaxID=167645 RepID=UPI001290B08F|nr:RNA 2',3'-cyclic phosphodiesterase [Propionivibrio limicola]
MRLFFALWPPADARRRLAAGATSGARLLGGRATRVETIHLTLVFLGEVAEAQLPLVLAAGERVRSAPFELRIDQLGYWRHNRLLWAGCTTMPPELQSLVDDLRQALTEAGIAFDDAKRRFVPHVTLVRKVPEARVAGSLPVIKPILWSCARFALVESQLTEHGSVYRMLKEWPLAPD